MLSPCSIYCKGEICDQLSVMLRGTGNGLKHLNFTSLLVIVKNKYINNKDQTLLVAICVW